MWGSNATHNCSRQSKFGRKGVHALCLETPQDFAISPRFGDEPQRAQHIKLVSKASTTKRPPLAIEMLWKAIPLSASFVAYMLRLPHPALGYSFMISLSVLREGGENKRRNNHVSGGSWATPRSTSSDGVGDLTPVSLHASPMRPQVPDKHTRCSP